MFGAHSWCPAKFEEGLDDGLPADSRIKCLLLSAKFSQCCCFPPCTGGAPNKLFSLALIRSACTNLYMRKRESSGPGQGGLPPPWRAKKSSLLPRSRDGMFQGVAQGPMGNSVWGGRIASRRGHGCTATFVSVSQVGVAGPTVALWTPGPSRWLHPVDPVGLARQGSLLLPRLAMATSTGGWPGPHGLRTQVGLRLCAPCTTLLQCNPFVYGICASFCYASLSAARSPATPRTPHPQSSSVGAQSVAVAGGQVMREVVRRGGGGRGQESGAAESSAQRTALARSTLPEPLAKRQHGHVGSGVGMVGTAGCRTGWHHVWGWMCGRVGACGKVGESRDEEATRCEVETMRV